MNNPEYQARLRARRRTQLQTKKRRAQRMRGMLSLAVLFALFLGLIAVSALLLSRHQSEETATNPLPEVQAEEDVAEAIVYTIVLDSGHSTYNAGAHGIVNEEDITAATTEYLRLLLENDENYDAILTHEYDVYIGIADRRQVGIDNEADFFISIHCNINADDSSLSGFEIYPQLPEQAYYEESYAVASFIAQAFVESGHTPRTGTGIFYCRYITDANGNDLQYALTEYDESVTDYGGTTYGVINTDEYPGILIEQGYVTSQSDVDEWMSEEGMQAAAQIYYEALCSYFGTETVAYVF